MKFYLTMLSAVLVSLALVSSVTAQRRDYVTEQEIELIRDNQDIDKRIDVLTKMIDRRFAALNVEVGGWKQSQKDMATWGDIRSGSRADQLYDIRQLLQKAIDDIDDVAMHNENTLTQNKREGLLFPKAVRNLAGAATRYQNPLKTLLNSTKDEKERGLIIASLEHCQAIIDSVTQLPAEVPKEGKKKT